GRIREVLADGYHVAGCVRPHVSKEEAGRNVGEVDLPAHAGLIELVEDGAPAEAAGGQIVANVAERGPRQEVLPVGKSWTRHRGEIAIADRESAVEGVVEGQVVDVVETHGTAAGRVGWNRVGGRETVHLIAIQRVVGPGPGVVQVGDLALCGLMEDSYRRGVLVQRVRVAGVPRLGCSVGLTLEVQLSEV